MVLSTLPQHADIQRYWVAYSGGLDSHVLLHSLVAEQAQLGDVALHAVHVNHGLSPHAARWATHCAGQCAALDVPLTCLLVDARPTAGESPEAAAREVRYQAFATLLESGDCLLTAHHQDDQAETLLLQLLRGAGPRGLAAMPLQAVFAAGWHMRPLLSVSRAGLEAYAHEHALTWVDDESNFDTGYDRNFLRREILPRLKERFPAAASTLSRSAGLCAEAAELLAHTAQHDLAKLRRDDGTLSVSGLWALGESRARNALHYWIHKQGWPVPSAAQLARIWTDMVGAREDSNPRVLWAGTELRRYRDGLYLSRPLPPHDPRQCWPWNMDRSLELAGLGRLSGTLAPGRGLSPHRLAEASGPWQLRFRQGGERLRPAGRTGHHALKKLLQEAGVPPWQRDRLPLLFVGETLIAVPGLWIAHEFVAVPGESGWEPVWESVVRYGLSP
jgi:tRNA(Ile)-lysidine synthase